ncbi:MAG TPA: hypothetical protein VEZ46_10335 [Mycobacteriales bacterium]|jgi:hypothetical protein|nr:hypothetical protein [Mycobacteriales bacterium]
MRDDMPVSVTGVPAYQWRCERCDATDLAASETEAVTAGRRHVAWTHPAPTDPQREAARRTAS